MAVVLLIAMALSFVRYRRGDARRDGCSSRRAPTGLKLGRIGRLKIEGVGGDIWRDFTVRRLTIVDEKGVWLDAPRPACRVALPRAVHPPLPRRRHRRARGPGAATAQDGTQGTASGAAPISVDIDRFAMRLEMLPEFSGRRGLYDVAGDYEMARQGGQKGSVSAQSLLKGGTTCARPSTLAAARP